MPKACKKIEVDEEQKVGQILEVMLHFENKHWVYEFY